MNRYLSGNYAPVTEEITAWNLPVIGEMPDELSGRYLRNGPNPATAVDASTHHWFVGDGMVHGLRIRDGRVEWYRNRYVGSAQMSALRGEPDIDGPNWNGNSHGPNTNVFGFAGTTWAVVEAGGCPVELSYELDTIGRNDFFGTLPGAFTAHPKFDPDTGEIHAIAYSWAEWIDHVQYLIIGVDGRVRHRRDVHLPGMSMAHDMSLTGRYAVVYDQPVTVDLSVLGRYPFPFRWNPGYGNRVGLIDRDDERTGRQSDIIWIDAPLGYCFHPVNAYDDDGSVVIDLCLYDRMFDTDVAGPFGDGVARLERWVIDPVARSLRTTVVDERANEFPRVANAVATRRHRYAYTVEPSVDPQAGWATVKHDLTTGERRAVDHGPGRAAGEAVFVGRADHGPEEDDGWLLTLVHVLGSDSAEFVVLDAQDLDRGPVARVPLPARVPFGFHGNWISDRTVAPLDDLVSTT